MGEDVAFGPSRKVELRAGRQEVEAALRQCHAAFALQHEVQLLAQLVEVQHIRSRIIHLFGRQLRRAPVGRLLLLGDIHADEVAAQVFKPVAVGEGAHQFRGDFGAVDRVHIRIKIVLEDGDVEPREMEDFHAGFVFHQGFQARRVEILWVNLHQMRIALAVRQLHDAEAVTQVVQAHGFRVHGDIALECHIRRKITFMHEISHGKPQVKRCSTIGSTELRIVRGND